MYKLDKCPYCGGGISLTTNDIVYGKIYGNGYVYVCDNYPTCDSYVGTHKDISPLGRLSNKELRRKKQVAHVIFDCLWKWKKVTDNDKKARIKAYKWLACEMGKKLEDTHIGYFDEQEVEKVIEICTPYINRLIKKYNLEGWLNEKYNRNS